MPKIDNIVLEIQDNLKDVEKRLAGFEKTAKKGAERTGKAIGAAITAFASSKVLGVIKDVFSNAIKDAARFETALLGLKAAANQVGQPFEQARKRVLELTKDGTLGVENVATSFKLLLNQGQNVDRAFRLTKALRNIGALNNIVGSTSQAVQDFIKGISTGSAELVENLDPSLRATINSYGGLAKVSKDATAQQDFFNAVIEKGESLSGAYEETLNTTQGALSRFEKAQENLNVTIGKAVEGPFQALLNFGADALNSFGNLIQSLGPVGGAIATIGGGIATALPGIVGFGASLGQIVQVGPQLLGVLAKLGAFFTGPFGLAALAIVGTISAIAIGLKAIEGASRDVVKETQKETSEFKRLEQQLANLNSKTKLTAAEKEKLSKANEALEKSAIELGVALKNENGELRTQQELLQAVKVRKKQKIIADINELSVRLNNLKAAREERLLEAGREGRLRDLIEGFGRDRLLAQNKVINDVESSIEKLSASVQALSEDAKPVSDTFSKVSNSINNSGKAAKDFSGFLKSQFIRDVESLRETFSGFQSQFAGDPEALRKGQAEFTRRFQGLLENQRNLVRSFNDEREAIEISRLQAEFDAAERSLKDRLKIEEDLNKERIKLEKKLQEKIAKVRLDSTRESIEQVNQIIGQAGNVAGAISGGGASDIFGSIGGLASSIPGGQVAGAALSGLSVVTGFVEDLTSNAEQLQQQEEIRTNQLEAQNRLLDTQLSINRTLADLNRQRSQLITDETRRQIQVNELTLGQEQARAANIKLLQDLASERASQIGLSGADPVTIAEEISRDELVAASVQAAVAQLQAITNIPTNISSIELSDRINQLRDISQIPDLPASVSSRASRLIQPFEVLRDQAKKIEGGRRAAANQSGLDRLLEGDLRDQVKSLERTFAGNVNAISSFGRFQVAQVGNLESRLSEEATRGQELLDLLGEIQGLQGTTSGAGSLSLQEGRRVSFVDIGARALQDLTGQRVDFARPQLGLPSGIGPAVAGPERKSFQQRQAESLEKLLEEAEQQTALLGIIASNLSGTSSGLSQADQNALVIRATNDLGQLQIR